MSVESAKFRSDERLTVFAFELWGTKLCVAAVNAGWAKWFLAHHHHFAGHWLASPSVKMENLGWDSGPDAVARQNGEQSRIFGVVSEPFKETRRPRRSRRFSPENPTRAFWKRNATSPAVHREGEPMFFGSPFALCMFVIPRAILSVIAR